MGGYCSLIIVPLQWRVGLSAQQALVVVDAMLGHDQLMRLIPILIRQNLKMCITWLSLIL